MTAYRLRIQIIKFIDSNFTVMIRRDVILVDDP